MHHHNTPVLNTELRMSTNTHPFLFHSSVPKDRDKFYFKLRQGVQKKVVFSVQQMCNKELGIER